MIKDLAVVIATTARVAAMTWVPSLAQELPQALRAAKRKDDPRNFFFFLTSQKRF